MTLLNQRHFYFAILSNFVVLFILPPFRVKYWVTISKRCVTHMARVISFVTKRYIWVGVVKKHDS